jgi:hypothetical protein
METPKRSYTRDQVRQIYTDLAVLYSSPYPDKAGERQESIQLLEAELNEGRVTPELLTQKMKELIVASGEKTSKLNSHILDHFWKKTYIRPIPRRRFNRDEA